VWLGNAPALAPVLAMILCHKVDAAVLLFDQVRMGGNVGPTVGGSDPEQDHDDRVNDARMNMPGGQFTCDNPGAGFTPNVVIEYLTTTATTHGICVTLWQGDDGDLIKVVAGWPRTHYRIDAVRVGDGKTSLFAEENVLIEGDCNGARHTVRLQHPAAGSRVCSSRTDFGNQCGNRHDNIGIENVCSSQARPSPVPAPASPWLFGLGRIIPGPRFKRAAKRRRASSVGQQSDHSAAMVSLKQQAGLAPSNRASQCEYPGSSLAPWFN